MRTAIILGSLFIAEAINPTYIQNLGDQFVGVMLAVTLVWDIIDTKIKGDKK